MRYLFLKVLVLNFSLIFVFALESLATKKELLKFVDNDSRGGWLSGDMIVSIPDDTKLDKKFVLRWGNNPHELLGMFLPIVTFPIKKPGLKLKIKFKETKIPPGATHIILFSVDENEHEKELFSLPFADKGVPESKPQGIIFEQTAKKGNSVKGRIILTRAWDERNLSHYAVYWGTGERTVLRKKPPVAIIVICALNL